MNFEVCAHVSALRKSLITVNAIIGFFTSVPSNVDLQSARPHE